MKGRSSFLLSGGIRGWVACASGRAIETRPVAQGAGGWPAPAWLASHNVHRCPGGPKRRPHRFPELFMGVTTLAPGHGPSRFGPDRTVGRPKRARHERTNEQCPRRNGPQPQRSRRNNNRSMNQSNWGKIACGICVVSWRLEEKCGVGAGSGGLAFNPRPLEGLGKNKRVLGGLRHVVFFLSSLRRRRPSSCAKAVVNLEGVHCGWFSQPRDTL